MSEETQIENPYLPVELPEFGVSVGWAMCRNTMCKNFGVQYEGPAPDDDGGSVSDDRYTIVHKTGTFRCRYCNKVHKLRSNSAIRVVARHFLSLSLPFATCPNSDCENHFYNAFEHHPHGDRRVRGRRYRRVERGEEHRMLCRSCSRKKKTTFPLGEPLHLSQFRVPQAAYRNAKKLSPDEKARVLRSIKKTRMAAVKRLRSVFEGAMYYRSLSNVVENFEISEDTYYRQLKRAAARLRDYLAWQNAQLLQEKFSKQDEPVRVHTDTLTVSLERYGKGPRYSHLRIPVSVINLPKQNTYYILAAHPGFLPIRFCQTDIKALGPEVSVLPHLSRWDGVEHPILLDPLSPTREQINKLPRVHRSGWFTVSPFTELAHFLTVRKMLSRFPKVYHYMDGEKPQMLGALTALASDIRSGRCEIALYQRLPAPDKGARRQRWPDKKKPEDREKWLKEMLDAQWLARKARWDERVAPIAGESGKVDAKTLASHFAPAPRGAETSGKWDWLAFPPPGPRFAGGRSLWLTRRPGVTYEDVGRELLWRTSTLPVDQAHAHLRDDVRALRKPGSGAKGRSFKGSYWDPMVVAAELWIAVFWRNYGPRAVPRHRLKEGEEPRRSPAFSMGLARKNAPRKPNIAKLVWDFRLGLEEAKTMSQWLQKK